MNESTQPLPSFRVEAVTGYSRPVAVPAPTYSAKVARQIIELEVTVQPIQIGGAWGLDLSSHSCEICGGTFPTRGDASMFLTRYGDPAFVHLGCEKQVEDWA